MAKADLDYFASQSRVVTIEGCVIGLTKLLADIMITLNDIIIMRTIVDLSEEQVTALAKVCREKNISRAEAVRRAVDGYLGNEKAPSSDVGFGLWRAKAVDSRDLVDRLRSEWER